MADNKTQIIITAEDKTAAAFASARAGLEKFSAAYASLGSLAGVGVVAGLAASVKSTIDLGDHINDLSQSVGISIKDLATWTLAANQSGTSLESVAKGVKGLSTFMVENGDALKKAGINATDANGALIQLADLFKALPDGVEKSALAVKLFGKAGLEMIPLLNQGSEGLKEAAEKAKKYGERMALLAPLADKFNDQLAEIALQSKETGLAITTVLMPGLIGMATWLNDLKAGGDRAAKSLEFLSDKSPLFAGLVKLHDLFNGGQSRSQGFSGEKNVLGLPISAAEKSLKDLQAFDAATESYMKERAAKSRALGLLGKAGADAQAEKRNAELERFLKLGQQNLMGTLDSEEEQRLLAHKREVSDIAEAYGKLNAMIAATPTGILEKSREDIQLLAKAFDEGRITEEQFSEAAQTRLGQLGDKVKEVDNFARDMGLTFASAFEEAVIGGRSLADVLKGLVQDVERIVLRKTVTEPLGKSVESAISGSSGGGLWGGIKSLFGFASGGSFTVGGSGGTDSQLVAFRATPGEHVSVATPAQRGGGITVNIIEDSARAGQTQARQSSGGGNILDVFVEQVRATVASDIARGSGPISNAMASTYGLNRAAGAY